LIFGCTTENEREKKKKKKKDAENEFLRTLKRKKIFFLVKILNFICFKNVTVKEKKNKKQYSINNFEFVF